VDSISRFFIALALTGLLMASSAASAYGFEWWINNQELGPGGRNLPSESFASINAAGRSDFIEVPTLNLTIECTEEVGFGKIFPGGFSESTMKFRFCRVTKPQLNFCVVSIPGSFEAREEFVKTANGFWDRFEPKANVFLTITLQNCALAGTYPLKGSAVANPTFFAAEEVEQSVRFSEALTTIANLELKEAGQPTVELRFGTRVAFLQAKSFRALNGANEGANWGAR
jgi:hypothetical protein